MSTCSGAVVHPRFPQPKLFFRKFCDYLALAYGVLERLVMDGLPNELLALIFTHLNTLDKSVICGSVCQKWRAVAKLTSLWRKIKFEPYFNLAKMTSFLGLDHIQSVITTLDLRGETLIPDILLPNLRVLYIETLDTNIVDCLANFPKLTSLYVETWKKFANSFETRQKEPIVKLRSLRPDLEIIFDNETCFSFLEMADPAQWTAIREVASLCTLNYVGLLTCHPLDQEFVKRFSSIFPKLRSLHWAEIGTMSCFSSILTKLSCRDASATEVFVQLPQMCHNLVDLCSYLLRPDSAPFRVVPFPTLRKLNIDFLRIREHEIDQVLSVWTDLEELEFTSLPLRSSNLATIASFQPKLRKLVLPCTAYVINCGGQTKHTLPALEELTLTGRNAVLLTCLWAPVCTTVHVTTRNERIPWQDIELSDMLQACPSVRNISVPREILSIPRVMTCLRSSNVRELHITGESFTVEDVGWLQSVAKVLPGLKEIALRLDPGADIPPEEIRDLRGFAYMREHPDFAKVLVEQLDNFKELETCRVRVPTCTCYIFRTFKKEVGEWIGAANLFNIWASMNDAVYYLFPRHVRIALGFEMPADSE